MKCLSNLKGDVLIKRRVVVSGYGIVSPIGQNVLDFWQNLIRGKSGGKKISRFDVENYGTKIAAEIGELNSVSTCELDIKKLETFSQYALVAALEGWRHLHNDLNETDLRRTGVIIGSSNGGDRYIGEFLKNPTSQVDTEMYLSSMINSVPSLISKTLNITGPSWSISTACASGTNAIGEAMRLIQSNTADLMIAGGTDDGIQPLNMAGLSKIQAMTRNNDEPTNSCKPFDENRDGFLMGAGAGILILEEHDHAIQRGAKILAEIVGYGTTTDAYHITAPDPMAIQPAKAMQKAIEEAGLTPLDIDYINSHGTGTSLNDQMEAKAIHHVFTNSAETVPINAIKSMTGHMLGGSGAVETIATILAIENGFIPATKNCDNLDKSLRLNVIRHEGIEQEINYAMTNSFGFGGHNASLILKSFKGDK